MEALKRECEALRQRNNQLSQAEMQSKDQLFQHQALIRLLQEQIHKEKEKNKEKKQEKETEAETEEEEEKERDKDSAGRGQMHRGEEAVVENGKQTSQQRNWEIEKARFLAQIDDLTRKLHAYGLESAAHSAAEFEESESKVELKDEASLKAARNSSLGPAEAEEAKQEEVSLDPLGALAEEAKQEEVSLGFRAKQEEVSLGPPLGAFVPPADSIRMRRKAAAHTATDAAVMRPVTQVIAQARQRPVRWRVQIWRFAFEILGA